MRKKKRKAFAKLGRRTVRKAIVVGAISRKSGDVVLLVILDRKNETFQVFVEDVAEEGVADYANEHNRIRDSNV